MGCICSKATSSVQANDEKSSNNKIKDLKSSNASNLQLVSAPRRPADTVLLSANGFSFGDPISRGSSSLAFTNSLIGSSRATSKVSSQVTSGSLSRPPSKVNSGSLARPAENDQKVDTNTIVVERPSGNSQHQRRATVDLAVNGEGRNIRSMGRIVSIPYGSQGEQAAAGWPTWLTSVAGEAVHGWLPRRADSFEKIEKIGQGTYSSVYKARDLETDKIVAMKKVRFVNMDPESVRFMAREILILRKLDHPNVMKLEGLVTSRMSGSLYLVFEYMEHDLAGLLSIPGNKFTEPQIKCFVQQLLRGLKHCHSQGILHRDIKGSNLLINDDGVLKIGDFGLATCLDPNQKQQLTSRVVTLWYRAPELLLGSTDYGVAVDMWSVGCIIAELYAVKPIMPGRTEVEQMHKIFKLCGSPSDEYWKETKLPHATSFKPHQPYKRRVAETFKDFPPPALNLIESLLAFEPEKRGTASAALQSEFFTMKPLPCDPSSIPKYPPSKELDIRLRDEDPRRQKDEDQKERRQQVTTRDLRDTKPTTTQRYDAEARKASLKSTGPSYDHQGNGNAAFTVDTRSLANGSSTMVHPSAAGLSWTNNRKTKEDECHSNAVASSSRNITNFKSQTRRDDSSTVYLPKKNRIHYSGPLMPPGGNLEDMLKEHERQIQQAVRKSKARNANPRVNAQSESLQYHGKNLW